MDEGCQGVKTIQIHARTRYPIVSAYEFEFLKTEQEIQALLSKRLVVPPLTTRQGSRKSISGLASSCVEAGRRCGGSDGWAGVRGPR